MEKQFTEILKSHKTAPFLFVGSGFSRRYINTPDWKDLLAKISPQGKHYNSYSSRTENGSCPEVATLMSPDVNDEFWDRDINDKHYLKYKDICDTPEKALKFKVVDYLDGFNLETFPKTPLLEEELSLIRDLPIDGIITTNWDTLLNELFPKYKVFIGQNGLLSSSTSGIGEIYKIHGCLSKPSSMILTKDDYDNYNSKNAFLAAKLMTIFVEHPVIFLGYSLSDENIRDIISNLSKCCDENSIKTIAKNFIFIDWINEPDMVPAIESSTIVLDDASYFPIIKIKTYSYVPVFKCLKEFQRQIPTHLLRACKENFFNLIRTENPENNLFVADWNEFEKGDLANVQFVSGFGVIEKFSESGYKAFDISYLFDDYFIEEKKYDLGKLLTETIANIQGNTPIYKYLSKLEIQEANRVRSNFKCDYWMKKKNKNNHKKKNYYGEMAKKMTLQDALSMDLTKSLKVIPFLKINREHLVQLYEFLQDLYKNEKDKNLTKQSIFSDFRKCVSYYDFLKYSKYK